MKYRQEHQRETREWLPRWPWHLLTENVPTHKAELCSVKPYLRYHLQASWTQHPLGSSRAPQPDVKLPGPRSCPQALLLLACRSKVLPVLCHSRPHLPHKPFQAAGAGVCSPVGCHGRSRERLKAWSALLGCTRSSRQSIAGGVTVGIM